MEELVVLFVGKSSVSVDRIVGAVPVGFEFGRTFLEDLAAAFSTWQVVTQAEVLVEHECSLWDPLFAVLALHFVRIGWLFS